MTTSKQRSKRLQEFTAHESNVNCLALGHISGRVLVTGGYDRKVNLWAIGSDTHILSLNAHSSPTECVKFGHTEEYVGSGSQSGELNIWDLEANKKTRNFAGHKDAIKCMDFHPYGDFLASGSLDTSIKLWDVRRKGYISTYRCHTLTVNKVKFSPDGIWLASAGEDGKITLWDIRMRKLISELLDHEAACLALELHPHEFLLATGSADRSVIFWDLEKFLKVSVVKQNSGPIRSLRFSPEGECLFAGVDNTVFVFAWEPGEQLDMVHVGTGPVLDIMQNPMSPQLITASFHKTKVRLCTIDLKQVKLKRDVPLCIPAGPSLPLRGISTRKSFSKEKLLPESFIIRRVDDGSDRSGADTETDEPFVPQRTLNRTPPPVVPETREENVPQTFDPLPVAAQRTVTTLSSSEPLSLNSLDNLSPVNQQIQLKQTISGGSSTPRSPSPRNTITNVKLRRHSTAIDEPMQNKQQQRTGVLESPRKSVAVTTASRHVQADNEVEFPHRVNNIRPSPSEPTLHKPQPPHRPRKASFSDNTPTVSTARISPSSYNPTTTQQPITITPTTSVTPVVRNRPVLPVRPSPVAASSSPSVYFTPQQSVSMLETIGSGQQEPGGINFEDFLPKTGLCRPTTPHHSSQPTPSEEECLSQISSNHNTLMLALSTRLRSLQSVAMRWRGGDPRQAVEFAVAAHDSPLLVDLLQAINAKPQSWTLDLCATVLPALESLVGSQYEMHATVACETLSLILRNFAQVIRTNVRAPVHTVGTDIPREERYKKSIKCQQSLLTVRALLLKKQTASGVLGTTFRELLVLMENLEH